MTRFTLYYWPIPFRGIFIRNMLAFAEQPWEQASTDDLMRLKALPPSEQPLPFMAPPLVHDHERNLWLAQLPAILTYLGDTLALTPLDLPSRTITLKTICDANDVLDEITRSGGAQMWKPEAWNAFYNCRFPRWMALFEEVATRHHVTAEYGWFLRTESPSTADITLYSLWHTMRQTLPEIGGMLAEHAPKVSGLCDRLAAMPSLQAEWAKQGDNTTYCSGEIETSIREMLG